jgi:hypothetical protein
MKYNKQLFIDNINYLVKYNYEPEITIILIVELIKRNKLNKYK